MKIRKFYHNSLALFAVASLFFSCAEKDEHANEIAKVNFATTDLIEVEAATIPLGINVGIGSYYSTGGTIHIEVTGGNYGTDYTLSTGSSSFDLNVNPGSLLASFSITPIDDSIVVEDDVNLQFKITNVTGGLEIGENDIFNLKILNDDDPTVGIVSFENATYSFNEEDTTTKTINLPFNQSSTLGGTISIAATGSAVFGSDYSVQGQTTQNFTITVPPLATSASFSINSIDDLVLDNNKDVTFTITSVTGGLEFQSPSATTVTFIDNEVVAIPINYVETFEGFTSGSGYLATLGYNVQTINQASGITPVLAANLSAGNYADVNNVTLPSDKGINIFHNAGNAPYNAALGGDLDNVAITPLMNGNGNVTISVDCRYGLTAQNNAVITFYWSDSYTGGAFNPAQWTQIGTETAQSMLTEGFSSTQYKRKTMAITPTQPFHFAIRITQNINATNYRTQWRFDNIKITN